MRDKKTRTVKGIGPLIKAIHESDIEGIRRWAPNALKNSQNTIGVEVSNYIHPIKIRTAGADAATVNAYDIVTINSLSGSRVDPKLGFVGLCALFDRRDSLEELLPILMEGRSAAERKKMLIEEQGKSIPLIAVSVMHQYRGSALEYLVSQEINIDQILTKWNANALHIAAHYGATEAIAPLLAAGLPIDTKCLGQRTAFATAWQNGHFGFVERLLDHGCSTTSMGLTRDYYEKVRGGEMFIQASLGRAEAFVKAYQARKSLTTLSEARSAPPSQHAGL